MARWPELLTRTLNDAEQLNRLRFRAISWQELVPLLPLDDSARAWAYEKHALS